MSWPVSGSRKAQLKMSGCTAHTFGVATHLVQSMREGDPCLVVMDTSQHSHRILSSLGVNQWLSILDTATFQLSVEVCMRRQRWRPMQWELHASQRCMILNSLAILEEDVHGMPHLVLGSCAWLDSTPGPGEPGSVYEYHLQKLFKGEELF